MIRDLHVLLEENWSLQSIENYFWGPKDLNIT